MKTATLMDLALLATIAVFMLASVLRQLGAQWLATSFWKIAAYVGSFLLADFVLRVLALSAVGLVALPFGVAAVAAVSPSGYRV